MVRQSKLETMNDENRLHELFSQIQDKEGFVSLVRALSNNSEDFKDEWENLEISSFLSAFAAYCDDTSTVELSWKELGRLFLGAKVYE